MFDTARDVCEIFIYFMKGRLNVIYVYLQNQVTDS